MTLSNLAALGAALCWAVGGLIAIGPVRAIGSVAFNRLRMTLVFAMLAAAASAVGAWDSLSMGHALLLASSGLVGILLGDTVLFWALHRLGPRRNVVVYATNAPITAVLAWLILGDTLGPWAVAGIVLVTSGVMLAVAGRPSTTGAPEHDWEQVRGPLAVGLAAGLFAALCQAAGTIIAKPVMEAGVHPVAASAVRVGIAAAILLPTGLLPRQRAALRAAFVPGVVGPTVLNSFIGMGVGMTLLMWALAQGNPGIVATLSATSPVLILPLLWLVLRRVPSAKAWSGAGLAVVGIALIVNR